MMYKFIIGFLVSVFNPHSSDLIYPCSGRAPLGDIRLEESTL
jgi:hypothetical protein